MRGRSGKLWATNDELIEKLVKDPHYDIRPDGAIWTQVCDTGKVSVTGEWREAGFARVKGSHDGYPYRYIGYEGRHLAAHRIVYRKFHGPLAPDLVVNHKDKDTLNNRPENLELVTQAANNLHAYQNGKAPVWGNIVLTWERIHDIREDWNAGLTNRQIRLAYGVKSKGWISEIVMNQIWYDPNYTPRSSPEPKASFELAEEIRLRYRNGVKQKDLAAFFGLGLTTIKNICANRIWKPAESVQNTAA